MQIILNLLIKSMANITETFLEPLENCSTMFNAGSALYIAPLTNCSKEPVVITLTLNGELTIASTTASVTLPATTSEIFLRAGSRIYFGTSIDAAIDYIIVGADLTIPVGATAATIAVESVSATIPNASTGYTWGMARLLSPTNIPVSLTATNVSAKSLSYGLQGAEQKVGVALQSQISSIADINDVAYWRYLYPLATSNRECYAFIVRNGGVHAFGRVQIGEVTNDGNIDELSRPSFTLMFQAPWAAPTLFKFLPVGQRTALNRARKLAGLAPLTVPLTLV